MEAVKNEAGAAMYEAINSEQGKKRALKSDEPGYAEDLRRRRRESAARSNEKKKQRLLDAE